MLRSPGPWTEGRGRAGQAVLGAPLRPEFKRTYTDCDVEPKAAQSLKSVFLEIILPASKSDALDARFSRQGRGNLKSFMESLRLEKIPKAIEPSL